MKEQLNDILKGSEKKGSIVRRAAQGLKERLKSPLRIRASGKENKENITPRSSKTQKSKGIKTSWKKGAPSPVSLSRQVIQNVAKSSKVIDDTSVWTATEDEDEETTFRVNIDDISAISKQSTEINRQQKSVLDATGRMCSTFSYPLHSTLAYPQNSTRIDFDPSGFLPPLSQRGEPEGCENVTPVKKFVNGQPVVRQRKRKCLGTDEIRHRCKSLRKTGTDATDDEDDLRIYDLTERVNNASINATRSSPPAFEDLEATLVARRSPIRKSDLRSIGTGASCRGTPASSYCSSRRRRRTHMQTLARL